MTEPPDLPAFRIDHWTIIDTTNGLGEAVLTFAGSARGYDVPIVLVVATNPLTGGILRCTVLREDGEAEKVDLRSMPGIVADLARTKTLEVFGR